MTNEDTLRLFFALPCPPEQAAAIARLTEGVVVGSALIDQIAGAKSPEDAVEGVLGLCRQLSAGVRGARG